MKLLLISFFFSVPVFAQSELPMLIQGFSNLGKPQQCTEADFQACAKSLCGDPSVHADIRTVTNFDERYNAQKYGKIPEAEKKIRSFIEAKRAQNQAVFDKIKANPSFAFSKWDDFSWNKNSFEVYAGDLEISYESQSDTLSIRPKSGAGGDAAYKKRLADYAERAQNYFRKYPYDLYLEKFISLEDYHKIEAKKFDYAHIEDSLCLNEECQKDVMEKLSPLVLADLETYQVKNNDQVLADDLAVGCLANYLQTAIDEEDAEKLKEFLPEAKRTIVERGLADFSEHSRAQFKNYLDKNVDFLFNIARPKPTLELLEDSNKLGRASSEEKILKDLTSFKGSPTFFRPFPEFPVCTSYTDDTFHDAFAVAEFSEKSLDRDKTPLQKDAVIVSMLTCRYHSAGKFVLIHELAHALSYVVSKGQLSKSSSKEYQSIRECASKASFSKAPPVRNMHPGDVLTSEEDMADLIAFKATRGDKDIGTCVLLNPDGEGYVQNDGSELSVSTRDSYAHSPSFVRVIREAIYRKEAIPKSCEPVVKEYRDNYKDRKLCI